MKKIIFFIFLGIFLTLNFAGACINSNDNYAAEVILPNQIADYNLAFINNAGNVQIVNNQYVFQSEFSNNISAILKEVDKGISVRIQMPTKLADRKLPYFRIDSIISGKDVDESAVINDWQIQCSGENCVYKQGNLTVTINLLSSKKYEVKVETSQNFENCQNCDDTCIYDSGRSFCVYNSLTASLEFLLRRLELINSFDDLLINKKVDSGISQFQDIVPISQENVNWPEALRQELYWLKSSNIISIKNSDIEAISKLANGGQAGNKKIVWNRDSWVYYDSTNSSVMQQECNTFSLVPTGAVTFEQINAGSLYYLVPLFIIGLILIIFLSALLVARVRQSHKRKKKILSKS